MAKTKYTTEVAINESDLSIGEIIKKGGEASLWEQIVASALLEEEVAELDALCNQIKERVRSSPLDEIKKSLIDSGKLKEGENPVIVLTTKYGDVLKISLSSDKDSGFTVDKSLGDFIDMLPDEMTRTPAKTLESKKVLETLFDAGKIPDIYKGYFGKHPTDTTKITIRRKEASK